MQIKSLKKIFQISAFVGFILTVYHLLSGEGVDAANYLLMRANDPRGIITWQEISNNIFLRHHLPFLITYPFSLLGLYFGGILYIFLAYLSFLFILKKINKIKSYKDKISNGYDFRDFLLLTPYSIIYILEPGKESIVFFLIASIFISCFKLNNCIKNRNNEFKSYETVLLIILFLLAVNLRPPILLFLGPALAFSFPEIFNLLIIRLEKYRFNIQYSLFIFFLIAILSVLSFQIIFNRDFYYQGIINLFKFGVYVYPEGRLNTGIDILNAFSNPNQVLFLVATGFIFGIPLTSNFLSNPLSLIVGGIYFITQFSMYIFVLPRLFNYQIKYYLKNLFYKFKLKDYSIRSLIVFTLMLISFFTGGLILSVGLTFNTGTGVRWMLPYIETLWLMTKFLPEKKLTNIIDQKKEYILKIN